MNKQLFSFRITAIAILVLALASCSKSNKEGKLVPANASYVVHFNGSQLSTKLTWEEVKASEYFKEVVSDSTIPPRVMDALNDPDKSGIDIKKDLLAFLVLDQQGAYVGFTGSIKDAEKFGLFNAAIVEEATNKQEGDIKYISSKPVVIGYDKEKFVYLINTPYFHRYLSMEEKTKGTRDMQQTLADIFKMPADKSLSSNSKFTKLMNDNADIHFWSNGEELAKGSGVVEMVPFIDVQKFTKGFVNTASATFNNGSINVKSRIYASKELSDVLKKYEGGNINEAMVNKLPANGINAALAINFKPEIIRELIKLTGLDGIANSELKRETGITLDDFIKANKGDLLIAVSNLHAKRDSFSFEIAPGKKKTMYTDRPGMDYLFSASVNDKQAFNKLIQAAQEKAKDFDEEDSLQSNAPNYSMNDQYFAIGNPKTAVDNYLANNGNNDALLKKMGKGPIGGYADLQAILKGIGPDANADSTDKVIHALAVQMWDQVTLKGGQIEDGGLVLEMEISLMDKNTNSLKQLSSYLQKSATLMRQQKKKERDAFMLEMPAVVEEPMLKKDMAPSPKK